LVLFDSLRDCPHFFILAGIGMHQQTIRMEVSKKKCECSFIALSKRESLFGSGVNPGFSVSCRLTFQLGNPRLQLLLSTASKYISSDSKSSSSHY
jgi:hypothetical protein